MTDSYHSNEVQRRAQALGVTLRRTRASDGAAMAALMNDEAVFPHTMQLPYTEAAFWQERLKDPGGAANPELSLAVEADGELVASAGLHPFLAVRRRHAMMLGIAVSGPWQGRGAGDLLMTALCQHADRWLGLLRIELTVFIDNERAIALYRKHGFEIEGTLRAFALRDGEFVDVLTMARLNPKLVTSARVLVPRSAAGLAS